MKGTTAKQVKTSKRFVVKTVKGMASTTPSRRVVTYKVSRLTRPWALEGTKSVIRALAGNALDGFDIQVKINDAKPVAKKRALYHA
jgi:hypothetical protein